MKLIYTVLGGIAALAVVAIIYVVASHPGQPLGAAFMTEKTHLMAISGDAHAQMTMARHAFTGDGVAKDEARGAYWTKRAAGNGSARAQGLMGVLYLGGIGVEQNFDEARKWFDLSSEKEAKELAKRLQILIEATAKLPAEEKEKRMKTDYAAAQKDIRSSFLKVLERPE